MAYIEPKTNWIAANLPAASDFNRIEGNIEAIVSEELTMEGTKTFVDGLKSDTIDDVSGSGVTIEGVIIKDGAIYGALWGA